MIKRIIFHIGVPKTATTSLQSFLWQSRKSLQEAGALYPSSCLWHDKSHHKLFYSLKKESVDGTIWHEWEREKELLKDEAARSKCTDLIISSELLANLRSEACFQALASGVAGQGKKEIFILLGLRNIFRLYLSNYCQRVRDPNIALSISLSKWVNQGLTIREIENALDWQHRLTVAGAENTFTRIETQSSRNPVPFLKMFARLYGLEQKPASTANASPPLGEILVLRRLNEVTRNDANLRLQLRSDETRRTLQEILSKSSLTRTLGNVEAGLSETDINTILGQQHGSRAREKALIGTSNRQYNEIYKPLRWLTDLDQTYDSNLPEISTIADTLLERNDKERRPTENPKN